MESIKLNHDGLLNLEQPMIKVPFEQMKRHFKSSQKIIEKEMTVLQQKISQSSPSSMSGEDVVEFLRKLPILKARLQESRVQELVLLEKTQARLDYLDTITPIQTVDEEAFDRWSKTRLNHLLVDYLSRRGFAQTASKLATDSGIEHLVDLELFTQAQKIEESLKSRSCTEALQWCAENKSNLKKIKSSLEFNLRLQEYIELVRDRKIMQAIQYCKKFLVPWSDSHLREIQQATGLLAFEPTTDCTLYKSLYDNARWSALIASLKQDLFTLNCLTKEAMLQSTLQAGMTALKTRSCYTSVSSATGTSDRNVNCPICDAGSFGILAQSLPNGHHVNSSLVCRISGKLMDESNPPLVLPNGYVYSTLALKEMYDRDGIIHCPRSGNTYTLSETRKAFIS